MLHDLQLAEFIYEQPSAGDFEYTFKHALTQEVAHQLGADRAPQARCMNAPAAAIETIHAVQLDDHLVELAHHYGRSADLAKAVDFLWRAGAPGVAAIGSTRRRSATSIAHSNCLPRLRKATPHTRRTRLRMVRLSRCGH